MNRPTDFFACFNQVRDHLPCGFWAEALLTLVNEYNPIGDFDRFKHEFVKPEVLVTI
jgi:hypothetical protein